ncbi:hypothetical protein DLJ53_18175 [Acuticoccus sediminis]|uniref:50S ribosomal protein L29 n=1 Tax=Acuticoccus sediminis TaxID=2184697 RepID=A0A8B2NUJ6_9HYPH|nr:hypothetical protein [Acuticoccus sediminis]RAI01144.1 hypothetical protein DLJ53_18175 [Acuticoccus sediminis]
MAKRITDAEAEASAVAEVTALRGQAYQERTRHKYTPWTHNPDRLRLLNRKIRALDKAIQAYRQGVAGGSA